MPTASTPRRLSASSTPSPLHSDTWRSADQPPMSTATRPKSFGLEVSLRMGFPDDLHFGFEFDSCHLLYGLAHVLNELFDVGRLGALVGEDEIGVQRRHLRAADAMALEAAAFDQ